MGVKIQKKDKKSASNIDEGKRFSGNLLEKEVFGSKGLNDKQKYNLYNQLAVLMKSGMSLSYALKILIEDAKSKEKRILMLLLEEIIKGKSFHQAMKSESSFSMYERQAAMIGEEIADLQGIFANLSTYFNNKIQQRKQIWSVLSYPIVILSSAILVIFFMIQFVIPTFEEVLVRMGGELPGITKSILSFAAFSRQYGLFFIIGIIAILLLDRLFLQKNESYQQNKLKILAFLPLVGPLLKISAISTLFNSLAMLSNSSISLIRSLQLVEAMIKHPPIKKGVRTAIRKIEAGQSLYQTFKALAIFDVVTLNYIKVGEESNQLGYYFNLISNKITEENREKVKLLNSVLEPLLILIIGGIVGFILIALYLPIFELSNSIQ